MCDYIYFAKISRIGGYKQNLLGSPFVFATAADKLRHFTEVVDRYPYSNNGLRRDPEVAVQLSAVNSEILVGDTGWRRVTSSQVQAYLKN